MNNPAALSITVPAFLCNYAMELDALNLCAALNQYGFPAEVREVKREFGPASWNNYQGSYHCTFSIWLKNAADHEKASEFKRGLYAAIGVKGCPRAFADGLLAGARLRGRGPERDKLPSAPRKQLKA